jgi:metal-responsive CopG/Arc/MetJ family transcriptional regulator
MRLDVPLLKRLDDFRFKYRFESRSEAARWLMKHALDQKPTPKSREEKGGER